MERNIFNYKKTIKNNISDYPLAKGLPEMHEHCSIHAHSDALSIMQRYHQDKEALRLECKYFDYEDDVLNNKQWLDFLLVGFFGIFLIFWEDVFKIKYDGDRIEINKRIDEYKKYIASLAKANVA